MSLAEVLPAAETPASPSRVDRIAAAAKTACARIAPLWPLATFVAVNPFLGFTDRPFESACADLRRIARVDMLPGCEAGGAPPPAAIASARAPPS